MFGIEYKVESAPEKLETLKIQRTEDKIDIVDETSLGSEAALAAYLASNATLSSESKDDSIVFDPHLGLATETLPEQFTCQDLWAIF